jgi:tubulin alpha
METHAEYPRTKRPNRHGLYRPKIGGPETTHVCTQEKAEDTSYEQWERNWDRDTRGRALFQIINTPTKKTTEIHTNLDKALSSIITQMRTGNIGLRHYLYQRKVPEVEDGQCQCRRGEQTVAHILFSCPRFKDERNVWRSEGTWSANLKKVLTDGKQAARAARYMLETKLLGQFRSADTENLAEH